MMTSVICSTCKIFGTCERLTDEDRAKIVARAKADPALMEELRAVFTFYSLFRVLPPDEVLSKKVVAELRLHEREHAASELRKSGEGVPA